MDVARIIQHVGKMHRSSVAAGGTYSDQCALHRLLRKDLHMICFHRNKELLLLVKTGVLATSKADILVTLAARPT